jgi:hypothetical protein
MKMIIFPLAVACTFSFSVHADEAFDKKKAEMTSHIDEHLTKLQEHKGCVSSASDEKALDACRDKMKEWRRSMRMEHMEKRHERMEKRMERMKKRDN